MKRKKDTQAGKKKSAWGWSWSPKLWEEAVSMKPLCPFSNCALPFQFFTFFADIFLDSCLAPEKTVEKGRETEIWNALGFVNKHQFGPDASHKSSAQPNIMGSN